MRKLITIAATLALAAGLSSCKNEPAQKMESLHVEGTQLYAGEQPIRLKGISFGWHNIWPRFYNSEALAQLHNDWGANLFRAAIGSDDHAVADNPGIPSGYINNKDFALECLYKVIDAAIANDSYIIVDWHSHDLYLEEARDFFTQVATKYPDCPNVIYELFNEPVSREFNASRDYSQPTDESLEGYWNDLKEYAESLIETITSISTAHPLILMGCPQWDQDIHLVPANPIEGYDNVMYTVHFYAATHKDYLRERSDYALSQGIPVFLSECAGCEASGDGYLDIESWETWDKWAEERNISSVVWSISDKNETCSMFTPEASSEGPWNDEVIKEWGKIVKNWLK